MAKKKIPVVLLFEFDDGNTELHDLHVKDWWLKHQVDSMVESYLPKIDSNIHGVSVTCSSACLLFESVPLNVTDILK